MLGLGAAVLTSFQHCVVESILTSSMIVWYSNYSELTRSQHNNSSFNCLRDIFINRYRTIHWTS